MKSLSLTMLILGLSIIPAYSGGYGDEGRTYRESRSDLTLIANNMGGNEISITSVPFAENFTVSNAQQAIPRGPSWRWIQFSVEFNEGDHVVKTACSAYGEGQDAASYDMMIPTHQLPSQMRVLVRTHDFGGTPSYDCAVYPNLPYHFFRPRR